MRGIEVAIVGAGDTGANVRVRIPPPGFMGKCREWPLDTTVMGALGGNPVRAAGETLLARLQLANQEIIDAINILLNLSPAEINPLYLRISDTQAACLPWETLYANGDFIALQPPWQIVRMSEPAGRQPDREFVASSELRVVAVLSALGQPALEEWVALRDAAAAARAAPDKLNVTLAVFVGEPGLKKQIDDEVAGGCDFVSAFTVPSSVSELLTRVAEEKPQLLHLYCHGSVHGASRRLHFGTVREWAAKMRGAGSLNVGIAPLAQMVLATSWLVVINACEGGADTDESYSLISELVRQGLPAAIGHRRPISPDDAHRFAEALYPSLFRLIANEIAAVGGDREIEWAEALYGPRSSLHAFYGNPEDSELWSLPVLHVRDVPFKVRIVPAGDARAAAAASAEIGTKGTLTEAVRAVADLGVPPEVVDEILMPLPSEAAAQLRTLIELAQPQ